MRSGAGCLGAVCPGDEGPGARGEGATAESKKKKVWRLEVKEKEIRKSNPIVILGGKVDLHNCFKVFFLLRTLQLID